MDNNLEKYLPSKKFITTILVIVALIVIFFAIKGGISLLKNKTAKGNPKEVGLTVGAIVQKDGNNNGIADWEEYLWGLNPNKNGPENKELILAKKKELEQKGIILKQDDSRTITESEFISREFFAAIISLQQTGDLNDETMKSISESLGQNIVPSPIEDIYKSTILTIISDSKSTREEYSQKIGSLVKRYSESNIGSELTFVIQGLSKRDPQALYAAKTVGDAYISFGEEFVKIPTPKSLYTIHLNIANNYEKTGQSIIGLTKILTEPLIGMRSIINYKKYNDLLASDLEKISNLLQ